MMPTYHPAPDASYRGVPIKVTVICGRGALKVTLDEDREFDLHLSAVHPQEVFHLSAEGYGDVFNTRGYTDALEGMQSLIDSQAGDGVDADT